MLPPTPTSQGDKSSGQSQTESPRKKTKVGRANAAPVPVDAQINTLLGAALRRRAEYAHEVETNINRDECENRLCIWGYMLSTTHSFLLSKESRCGQKNERCERTKGDLVLKDYNGDNLAASGYLIGSAEECDVCVPGLARHHCVIYRIRSSEEDTVYVQCSGDSVIHVDDELVDPCESRILRHGDAIQLTAELRWNFYKPQVEGAAFSDRFERGRHLGKGHFADVYEVTDRQSGQKFAAKVIKKHLIKGKAFLHEIGLLMSCTHPAITCLRDVFDTPEHVFIILELAAGGELFDRIVKEGKFSEQKTRLIFRQLFEALEYLHANAIVHRDIKPENILLSSPENFEVRLADFGLAKIIQGESAVTSLAGTPSYIPPEMLSRANDNQLHYSRKVDSWSAGVVLYICLCGFPPFSEELAPPGLRDQIRQGRFAFTRPYWDSVSDEAKDLVQKLLTVDVSRRFSIFEALQHPFMTGKSLQTAVNASSDENTPRTMMRDLSRDVLAGRALP
ncbi:serine/threonine protein kinase [Savitreella phatthalungensis]